MSLLFSQFIEKALSKAVYEHDDAVNQWAAWIKDIPGVYAQGPTIEVARDGLVSVLEDYLIVSLREGKRVPGFSPAQKIYAKTH